jgi:hypothetical protein
MKTFCPNNPKHKLFVTTAHVVEEWLVNENGDWLETLQTTETAHGPSPENTWTCYMCGATAEFEPTY